MPAQRVSVPPGSDSRRPNSAHKGGRKPNFVAVTGRAARDPLFALALVVLATRQTNKMEMFKPIGNDFSWAGRAESR
jgi:hypothetical protein